MEIGLIILYLILLIIWMIIWLITLVHEAKKKKYWWLVITALIPVSLIVYWIIWISSKNFRKMKFE
jgi:hypothetical protein